MAGFIEQTIASVLSQDYPHIEYIVVDGGSTDGTVDLLRRYGDHLAFTSGRDAGPADAINRGLARSTGAIFAWLNADDVYLPGAVRAAVEGLAQRPDADAVYGEACWIDAGGRVVAPYPTRDFEPALLGRECFICQPACFMRRPAFSALRLDPELQYAFDYDLWIRAAGGHRFARIPPVLAHSRMHLGNRTLGQRHAMLAECMRMLRRHYGYVPFPWVHTYCSYVLDHRDQFFEPLRPTLFKYLLSLPVGCWHNRRALGRYWEEWRGVMGLDALRRRCGSYTAQHQAGSGPAPPGAE